VIKQFTQGNPATEDDLFISLGSMVLSKDVHDKMGKPVNWTCPVSTDSLEILDL
jgi:hypothetical protein